MVKCFLECRNVAIKVEERWLFRRLDFSLPQGESIAVVGVNGVGKSSLLKIIMGYLPVFSGEIKVLGYSLKELQQHYRRKIVYLPQETNIDWHFPITVFEVVSMGIYSRRSPSIFLNRQEKKEIESVLTDLSLTHLQNVPIGHLSGGEKRRMLLARALLQNAEVYLLDEPFAGVDVKSTKVILDLFQILIRRKKTVVAVNHDLASVKTHFSWCLALVPQAKDECYVGVCDKVMNQKTISKIFAWQ